MEDRFHPLNGTSRLVCGLRIFKEIEKIESNQRFISIVKYYNEPFTLHILYISVYYVHSIFISFNFIYVHKNSQFNHRHHTLDISYIFSYSVHPVHFIRLSILRECINILYLPIIHLSRTIHHY